jgi:hypothetical protein
LRRRSARVAVAVFGVFRGDFICHIFRSGLTQKLLAPDVTAKPYFGTRWTIGRIQGRYFYCDAC